MLTLQLIGLAFFVAALVYSLRIYSKPLYSGYWLLGLWEWLVASLRQRLAHRRYWRWRERMRQHSEARHEAHSRALEAAINAHIAKMPGLPEGERPRFVIDPPSNRKRSEAELRAQRWLEGLS